MCRPLTAAICFGSLWIFFMIVAGRFFKVRPSFAFGFGFAGGIIVCVIHNYVKGL